LWREPKERFFSKILGFDKKSVSDEEEGLALEHYEKMQKFVTELENEITRLEHRLTVLSDEKIGALS